MSDTFPAAISDGEPRLYALHGILLRSPVPLVGFPANDDRSHDVDVLWKRGEPVPGDAPAGRIVAAASVGDRYLYVAVDDGNVWTVRVPGFCDFVIERGLRAVECRVDPGADPGFVALLLGGLGVAFLLSVGGHTVLHASAVEVGGAAIAFAGASGSGKSTLAALLCGAGARMVTDDVLRVGMDPRPVCIGGSPQLRLRQGAAWVLDELEPRPATTPTLDDRLGIRPTPAGLSSVPLSVVVLPRLTADAPAVDLRPLGGAASLARLAGVCRVSGWQDPDVLRAQFHSLARLAAGAAVVEVVIPWGPASRSAIVPALLELAERSAAGLRAT